MQAVILLGAPGAGKGTAAEGIKEDTDFIHVSTGDMLREAIKAGRPVGLEAKSYMDAGELVPDEVIMKLVQERLEQDRAGTKYLFDGFPRTLEQARLMDDVLSTHGTELLHVFLLEVPEETIVSRMSGRRICRQCGAVYHIPNIPPRKEGVCDTCGGELYQRDDDAKETVLNRLAVFREQTESLIDYYSHKGLLVRIDSQGREETHRDIMKYLGGGPAA